MKKVFHRALCGAVSLFVCFSLAACGNEETPPETPATESETELIWDTIKETETETERITETETETETEPETEAEIETEPPEPEPPAPDPDLWDVVTPQPDPTPYIPTGDGIAPLVLMYHCVSDTVNGAENLHVRPSELRGHIEALIEKGYTFIFADEFGYSDRKTVIMTFDDGYTDNYTEMFPIIKEYNVKVTVFVISDWIEGSDFMTAAMIKEMSDSGLVSIQSHTANHYTLSSLGENELRDQFSRSKDRLESITGRSVKAISYPGGFYNAQTIEIAKEYYDFGYTTHSSNTTAGYSVYELPRIRVLRGMNKASMSYLIP